MDPSRGLSFVFCTVIESEKKASVVMEGKTETNPKQLTQHFTMRHDGKDLKKRSVRSGAVTLTSQATLLGLQTASTVVLARLLMPRDFGIIAMVVAFTAFAEIFRDMGLSTATIQREELTHTQVSAMFWLNVLVGTILTFLVMAIAPVLVWFYQKPEVFWVTIALSMTFVVSSFGIQHAALLNREMRFRALAVTQVTSAVVGIFASILAALFGLGYWALVLGTLVNSVVRVVLLWALSKWRPGRPERGSGAGALFHFGANVTGFELANYLSRNLDNVLIGRIWGGEVLGLYSRAYSLMMLPINNLRAPLAAVAMPAMSHLQRDPARYRSYLKKYVSLLSFASMPLAAFLFVCSDNAIRLLLGSRWIGASEIFRLLTLTAFMQPVASTRGLVMLSSGLSRRYLWWGIWNAALTVAAFGIGIFWGPMGVALAYGIVNYLILYPSLHYSFKGTPIGVADFFEATAKAAIASLVAGGIALTLKNAVAWSHDLSALLGCGATFLFAYLAVFVTLPGGWDELRESLSYRSLLFARKQTKVPLEQAAPIS